MQHAPVPWLVAVGASGSEGLCDIRALLRALPASLPAIVLVVLHRPWDKVSHLQAVLGQASAMPVIIAHNGEHFEAGIAYIGKPAEHLTLAARSFAALVLDPSCWHRNRTVDLLFHSVAAHGGERIIGIVLSGWLDDGSRGLAAIHQAGGLTMVVTPGTQPWQGMPENAIAHNGPVSTVGTPRQIAAAIQAAVRSTPRNGIKLM